MPFEHAIDEKNRLLVIQGSGASALEEFLDSLSHAVQSVTDGKIPSNYGALININAIAQELTPNETEIITQFVTLLKRYLQGPIAIVASAIGKVIPAIMIAIYAYAPAGTVQTFESESEARDWVLARCT